MAFTLLPISAD